MPKHSTSFPKITLGSAYKILENALKFGKAWTREEFAGYGSKKSTNASSKSGAFATRIAALRSYGLIASTKDTVVATELAEQLIRPIDAAEQNGALVKAFLNVDIFKKIYEESSHGTDLARSNIHAIAVTRFGIARDQRTVSGFLNTFIKSGVRAGLISVVGPDVIRFNDSDQSSNNSEDGEADASDVSIDSDTQVTPKTDEPMMLTAPQSASNREPGQKVANVQGVDHVGKNWRLVVTFSSSLTIKSEVRKQIRELIEKADLVADTFYDIEEREDEPV